MNTLRDLYKEAIIGKYYSLRLVIEYLVNEKKVLTFEDGQEKLDYYLQERFRKKLNEYLADYDKKRNGAK